MHKQNFVYPLYRHDSNCVKEDCHGKLSDQGGVAWATESSSHDPGSHKLISLHIQELNKSVCFLAYFSIRFDAKMQRREDIAEFRGLSNHVFVINDK